MIIYIHIIFLIFVSLSQVIPIEQQKDTNSQTPQSSTPKKFINDEEKIFRTVIQNQNLKQIVNHNENSNTSYGLGENQFVYFTDEEFSQIYFGLLPTSPAVLQYARGLEKSGPILTGPFSKRLKVSENQILEEVKNLFAKRKKLSIKQVQKNIIQPFQNQQLKSVNTEQKNENNEVSEQQPNNSRRLQTNLRRSYNVDWSCMTGQVKNQGRCGSCYIFSALEAFSSVLSIYYTKVYLPFSIQQILECQKDSLGYGCYGGFLDGPFSYMKKNGVSSNYSYPYSSHVEGDLFYCRRDRIFNSSIFRIKDYVSIRAGSCLFIKVKLQEFPISVGIQAVSKFRFYKNNVFDDCPNSYDLNHAVLLIGYKEGKGWKIKNTWGRNWGENGYGWISEERNCGLCEMAKYPLPLLQGYPSFSGLKPLQTCPTP